MDIYLGDLTHSKNLNAYEVQRVSPLRSLVNQKIDRTKIDDVIPFRVLETDNHPTITLNREVQLTSDLESCKEGFPFLKRTIFFLLNLKIKERSNYNSKIKDLRKKIKTCRKICSTYEKIEALTEDLRTIDLYSQEKHDDITRSAIKEHDYVSLWCDDFSLRIGPTPHLNGSRTELDQLVKKHFEQEAKRIWS